METERLIGARPLLRDADELHPICGDMRVAEWTWMEPLSLARTRAMLVKDIAHWKRHRFGRWVLRERSSGAVVGLAGLLALDSGEVELAWFLAPEHWRRGLTTEFAQACVRHAFDELELPALIAKTLPHNAASRGVMERLGMTHEADIEHAGMPHVLYRLTNASS